MYNCISVEIFNVIGGILYKSYAKIMCFNSKILIWEMLK